MPKQFRTKLAGVAITLSMVAAPVATFAADNGLLDGGSDIGVRSVETLPGPAHDSYYPENDLDGGQGGEVGTFDETKAVEVPDVDDETLKKPVSEGLGPQGGVMPTLDENGNNTNKVPNQTGQTNNNKKPSTTTTTTTTKKTTSKKTTTKKTSSSKKTISNPKTGDVSVLSYAGLGLVSVAGLLKRRK